MNALSLCTCAAMFLATVLTTSCSDSASGENDATPLASAPITSETADAEPEVTTPPETPSGNPVHTPVEQADKDEQVDTPEGPFTPSGALLPDRLPDRTHVFGEPISEIPDPDDITSEFLYWAYDLVDDQLTSNLYEAPLSHRRIWQRFAELIPADLRLSLVSVTFTLDPQYESIASANISSSGFTKIPGEQSSSLFLTEALVVEALDRIDAGGDTSRFDFVVTHEFAHVLEAYDVVVDIGNDPDYVEFESLFYRNDSLMGAFLVDFWKGDVELEWLRSRDDGTGPQGLYDAFPESFVSVYAANNPSEDFAESFTYFVFFDSGQDAENTSGADKLRFFRERSEMVALRERLRALH